MWTRDAFWAIGMVVAFSGAGLAQETPPAVDLVGRNGQFTVKHPDGTVEPVDSKKLPVEQGKQTAPRAVITDADAATDTNEAAKGTGKKEAGDGKVTTTPAAKPVTAPKVPAKPVETQADKAARAADIEKLRTMRDMGGTYFYTKDNTPISLEEMDRRIAAGDVADVKVVGLYLEEYTTKSKPAGDVTSEGAAAAPAPEPEPEPQTKHKKVKY